MSVRTGIASTAARPSAYGESLENPSQIKILMKYPTAHIPKIGTETGSGEYRSIRTGVVEYVGSAAETRATCRFRALEGNGQCFRVSWSGNYWLTVEYPGNRYSLSNPHLWAALIHSLGSRWKSDRWRTFKRCPLGVLGFGRGSGLGLGNHPVRSRGLTGGRGHKPRKFQQNIYLERGASASTLLM